jgi:hypothetical protein
VLEHQLDDGPVDRNKPRLVFERNDRGDHRAVDGSFAQPRSDAAGIGEGDVLAECVVGPA